MLLQAERHLPESASVVHPHAEIAKHPDEIQEPSQKGEDEQKHMRRDQVVRG